MIIDLQRRLAEIGRIRIGAQVATRNGKTRPTKLTTFRLTSADKSRIDTAAHLFGGTPAEWDAPAGRQWEVVTDTDAIDVIVPPSDMAFSQHYEQWAAGGCQRRCDGRAETISDGPCLCDPESRDCDIHTRLSVMLRDLPGLGVWRIDTSGYYAAVELQGAVEVVQMAAGRGQMLPARLRLEQRMIKRAGQETRRFAVPVLDIEVSPGQLLSGSSPAALGSGTTPQLEAAGPRQLDGAAPLTPVPESVPERPAASVAEQAAAAGAEPQRPRRKNAAQPVPSTGLPPRTAEQAAQDEQETGGGGEGERLITTTQSRKLATIFSKANLTERADRLAISSQMIGRPLASSKELTQQEASQLIDMLDELRQQDDFATLAQELIAADRETSAAPSESEGAGEAGKEATT
jgi:hypothetical protein